jgi:hypothetical protein
MVQQTSNSTLHPPDRLTYWVRLAVGLATLGCVAYASLGLYLTLAWAHGGPATLFSLVTLGLTWAVAVGTGLLVWFRRWRIPALVALCLPLLIFMLWCAAWPVAPLEFTQIR